MKYWQDILPFLKYWQDSCRLVNRVFAGYFRIGNAKQRQKTVFLQIIENIGAISYHLADKVFAGHYLPQAVLLQQAPNDSSQYITAPAQSWPKQHIMACSLTQIGPKQDIMAFALRQNSTLLHNGSSNLSV